MLLRESKSSDNAHSKGQTRKCAVANHCVFQKCKIYSHSHFPLWWSQVCQTCTAVWEWFLQPLHIPMKTLSVHYGDPCLIPTIYTTWLFQHGRQCFCKMYSGITSKLLALFLYQFTHLTVRLSFHFLASPELFMLCCAFCPDCFHSCVMFYTSEG